MLENIPLYAEETTRQLYVAITRAKQNLTIHLNTNHFAGIKADNMADIEDNISYPAPAQMAMHLTHQDVWLDYFFRTQKQVSTLMTGDELIAKDDGCLNKDGQPVLKFSKIFLKTLETKNARNYKLTRAKVNFIVYWRGESTQQEICIALPKLYFEKV